ncbi:MAG: hypothetical protein IKI57_06475 [Clostridia bacterium]|nr:hypothetical protein [Clostridia bacterium]
MKQTPRIKELLSTQTYSVEEVVEKIQVKTLLPQDNDNFFKDIIGNTNIVKYFSNMVRLLKRKRPIKGLGSYHPSFLLLGVSGIGKALTVYSFAKEMNLPIVVIDSEKLLQDFSIKIVNGLKGVIAQFDKCVVLFKDVNYSNMLDEGKMTSFLSKICQIKNSFPRSFFFASASQFAFYPQFFFGAEGFNNKVSFNSPDPKDREKLIKKFIANIPYDENLDFNKVARDFIGCSGGDIADILNKAWISCLLENKPKLTYEIINATIYSETFGNKIRKMSEKEMRLTAYHEAGHVIAGYYGSTDYKVSKVEVVFRPQSLGLTDPETDEDKLSYTREDIKGRIIHCLGGKVAEQIMFNTNTSGVSSDLSNATTLAESYVKYFGMDRTFGPICLQEEVLPSEYLNSIADGKIQEMLIELESKATEIVLEHKDKLIAIAEQLIKKETLYKEEVMAILEGDKKPQTTSTRGKKKSQPKT